MMIWLKRTFTLLLLILIAMALILAYAMNSYTESPVDEAWKLSATPSASDSVTVRYTGTATLFFSDGETEFITDGWFSRPNGLQLAAGTITPDMKAIDYGIEQNAIDKLAAVFVMHSHFDHSMDAPEVAQRTGALLLGSESTANIGRGWGLDENQIRVVTDRQVITLGKFVLTPIESQHFQFPDPQMHKRALGDPNISSPLQTPAKAFDYKLGKAYMLHVSHPKGSWLIVGSAGFVKDDLQGINADTVFLGIGGIGSQTRQYREQFWQETIGHVKPNRIIPIHYDSLTAPIDGPMYGPSLAEFFLSGGIEETLVFLKQKEAGSDDYTFNTLPRFTPITLYP
jgi:L-ascorbate metabolism protein UlaG (beta-lactamase superfamily)